MSVDRLDAIRVELADLIPPGEAIVFSREGYSVAQFERLAETLVRIRGNARDWHGPLLGTGHERALTVIATWCDEALGTEEAAQ